MKLLFGLVLSILAFVAIAERPSIPLNAMDWSTVSNNYDSSIFAVATAKDLLVYFDTSAVDNTVERGLPSPSGQPVMAVRRRNAEGVYVPVGNFTGFGSPSVTTNGKWVAFFGMGVALFSVDENNNTISSASFIPDFVPQGFLLSDDTFVGYEWSSPMDDGNYTIKSYQYESSNNTWNAIAGTEVVINYQLEFEQSGNTPYQVTDTHLVIVDPINSDSFAVNIFERQANKSWNFIESVPVNNNTAYVYYNGVDTIACVAPISVDDQSTGVLFVYTKMNGKWIEQMYDTISIGFRPVGYFGQVVLFVDANTLLVSAPFDGVEESNVDSLPTSGRIVVMTRNSTGLWEPSADLIGPGLFGLGIGVNDFDIVVPSISPFMNTGQLSVNFQTLPRCFNQPINVTCADEQANECSDIEISSLYTINNAQCGAVETTFGQLGLANNAIRAHLSFSRAGASVSCNVTVTCPSAPTFVQQQTPTGNAVSSAVGFELGLSLLASALAMFL